MGLSPIRQLRVHRISLTLCRVVLLVPLTRLGHLRTATNPDIFLSLSRTGDDNAEVYDDHFLTVHTAFVRVRRGRGEVQEDGANWRSLSRQLEVCDTRGDDPDAELMVSVVVPTFILEIVPMSQTKLQLRRLESIGLTQWHVRHMEKLGMLPSPLLYGTDLANTYRTAILTPGTSLREGQGGSSSPPLECPSKAFSSRCDNDSSFCS